MTDSVDGPLDALEEISFVELASRQQAAAIQPPLPSPMLLPFHLLHPDVFERVVAEIVGWHRNNQGAQFYGRTGQKQYGLDIVEHELDGRTSLYQVKRYKAVQPEQLRDAVEEYAGPPRGANHGQSDRRFNPHRFVVVTSAMTDAATANVDEAAKLRGDYAGDLVIEVWGAERLSGMLRDRPSLVTAVFGRAWAAAFCGVMAREADPHDPQSLGLVEEPVDVLGLGTVVADAQALETMDPAEATALYARVALALNAASYPGHAALMRARQAAAARAGGDLAAAFDLRFGIALDQLGGGENLWLRGPGDQAADAANLGGVRLDKWEILVAASRWPGQGTQFVKVADAATRLAVSGDGDAPLLCCILLEQAIVDGLFEFDPPRSMVSDTNDDASVELRKIMNAAEAVIASGVSDAVLRARLRCAVADAALRADSTPADVDTAYRQLVDDAGAGRLLRAAGLVASRAAYASAMHGDVDRAESLWRRSVLASGEARLYGDARNALIAIRATRAQVGHIMIGGLDTVARAMPNRRRLLESRDDPSLSTLAAVQNTDQLVDAFQAARHWLFESRLSGHLVDEMLAWRQFGRVLAPGGHPVAAVECFVLAGEVEEAGKAARSLSDLAETWRWTGSANRGRSAAAIRVAAEQASLHPDDAVPHLVEQLLRLADGLWTAPAFYPNPEREAVKAIARLGYRIPASAVDGILALAAPAIERPTGVSTDVADLLIQAYWAVSARRGDVADAIAAMLRHEQPPHNLWNLIENIPPAARDPLLGIVTDLADAGDQTAVVALAAWRHASTNVQLRARRAASVLLRRPVGHDRTSYAFGIQEDTVVGLVLGLLEAADDAPITPQALAPALCEPSINANATRDPGSEPDTESAQPTNASATEGYRLNPDDESALDEPDSAAQIAAGPRDDVAAAVAEKLLDLAEDQKDIGGSRQQALAALLRLLPRIPGPAAAAAAHRLADLHDDPGLSEQDRFEIGTNTLLSRARVDMGAVWLAPTALVAAAEALHRAGDTGDPLADDDAFGERLNAAALPLLTGTNDHAARIGARAVMAVAASHPRRAMYAMSLLGHPDPDVRAIGARYAKLDDQLVARLAADPAPHVRAAVASRGSNLPVRVRNQLADDRSAGVRHVLRHADD